MDYWHKQEPGKPLYQDLIWSKPENKNSAGKLLIIGGNLHGFSAVGQAYTAALGAGVGQVRIILPDALQKTVSKLMPEASFTQSTPSGSFAKISLSEILAQCNWASGVLIAGDLGKNSETAIMLEELAAKFNGQLTLAKDAADYFTKTPGAITQRQDTSMFVTIAQLQQLAKSLAFDKPFLFDMGLVKLVETLYDFSTMFKINIVLKHLDTIFVAVDGRVSTTKTSYKDDEAWRVPVAANSAVWWLQNPSKTFEALTTSLVQ